MYQAGRIAVYTCIAGGYDNLRQPFEPTPGFDFICLVGKGEKRCDTDGVWQIREIETPQKTPTLTARYAKTHPHEFFPDYDCSIWIDGNIIIRDGSLYKAARIKESAGVLFSGVSHPSRDCVYEEALKCRDMHYISVLKLLRIWGFLALHGVPRHAGLMETNLMFRRHNDDLAIRFDELWWDRISRMCYRDQLSHTWCMRKCGIKEDYLLPKGQSTRNHPGFEYLLHERKV